MKSHRSPTGLMGRRLLVGSPTGPTTLRGGTMGLTKRAPPKSGAKYELETPPAPLRMRGVRLAGSDPCRQARSGVWAHRTAHTPRSLVQFGRRPLEVLSEGKRRGRGPRGAPAPKARSARVALRG